MRTHSAIDRQSGAVGSLAILSVSPADDDHISLQAIIGHSKWVLFKARDLESALSVLQRNAVAVVLCERDLLPGTWTDVLVHTQALSNAPFLIVTSRLADDRIWAEALNLGAWDVLAKPFNHIEVIRSVKSAWQHWHDQAHARTNTMAAAS
jgi:DNA-binding NtrC family response regulator